MKKSLLVIFAFVLLPALASAQEVHKKPGALGYVFIAPGAEVCSSCTTAFLHFGGGGETDLFRGIGLGVELGYLSQMQSIISGVGLFSLNGIYSFRGGDDPKVVPFVTGGYSLAIPYWTAYALNFGAGVNYWLGKRVGIRLEFRDHVSPSYLSDHLVQGRFGLVFR